MKVGIMQPYFFPYIGYWQLINAVDKFVIYDDVNFIKGGWINRNKIFINGQARYINLQMYKASPNKLINEMEVLGDKVYNKKLLKTIEISYRKAPYYSEVYPLIESIIKQDENNMAKYLINSIREVCKYLEIDTQILVSSEIEKNNNLRGQDKIIEICKILGANQYINAIGGIELYSRKDFESNGILLNFLRTKSIRYKQFNDNYLPNLSIIDVIMFNSVQETKRLMEEYELC